MPPWLGRGDAEGIGLHGTFVLPDSPVGPLRRVQLEHDVGVVPVVVTLAHEASSEQDEVAQIDLSDAVVH